MEHSQRLARMYRRTDVRILRSPAAGDAPAPPERGTPLLEVRDLANLVSHPSRRSLPHRRARQGGRRGQLRHSAGQDAGAGGRVGCGKTTVGRTILRLIPATGGDVRYKGEDFFAYHGEALRQLRRQMQIVFQDPVSSLNPRMTIGNIIGEPIEVHGIAKGSEKNDTVAALLQRVGLDPSYRQPISPRILRRPAPAHRHRPRLSLSPDFIVCDEPVSALDVSIQSQILNLLDDLQKERGIAYLFIAHNLAVVEHFSDEVAVMYLGRIVEKAAAASCTTIPSTPTR